MCTDKSRIFFFLRPTSLSTFRRPLKDLGPQSEELLVHNIEMVFFIVSTSECHVIRLNQKKKILFTHTENTA